MLMSYPFRASLLWMLSFLLYLDIEATTTETIIISQQDSNKGKVVILVKFRNRSQCYME